MATVLKVVNAIEHDFFFYLDSDVQVLPLEYGNIKSSHEVFKIVCKDLSYCTSNS